MSVKVLVVGAGGIGCEVLKNLVLTGIKNITIVDLDSVDFSNLNRQFLFSRDDVGKPKAECAARTLRNYGENLEIQTFVQKIQSMDHSLLRTHDIVFGALDNFEARGYLNRFCLANDIPLIESGSTGNNGQVFPIWSAVGTECFECRGQPRVKSIPVCTIRLTPEKAEHCLAWGRYLVEAVFGPEDESNVLSEIRGSVSRNKDPVEAACEIAHKLFVQDIVELKGAREFVGSQRAPEPLKELEPIFARMKEEARRQNGAQRDNAAESEEKERIAGEQGGVAEEKEGVAAEKEGVAGECLHFGDLISANSKRGQGVLKTEDNAVLFVSSFCAILSRDTEVHFDKDDNDVMQFVAAASNLRMANYSIPRESLWECKSIAGSIQPAVASTNAIVAGIQVAQMLKILALKEKILADNKEKQTNSAGRHGDSAGRHGDSVGGSEITLSRLTQAGIRYVWVRATPTGPYILAPEKLDHPRENCPVCQMKRLRLILPSLKLFTVRYLLESILAHDLALTGDITIQAEDAIVYDPDMLEDDDGVLDRHVFTEESQVATLSITAITGEGKIFSLDVDVQIDAKKFEDLAKPVSHVLEASHRGGDVETRVKEAESDLIHGNRDTDIQNIPDVDVHDNTGKHEETGRQEETRGDNDDVSGSLTGKRSIPHGEEFTNAKKQKL